MAFIGKAKFVGYLLYGDITRRNAFFDKLGTQVINVIAVRQLKIPFEEFEN